MAAIGVAIPASIAMPGPPAAAAQLPAQAARLPAQAARLPAQAAQLPAQAAQLPAQAAQLPAQAAQLPAQVAAPAPVSPGPGTNSVAAFGAAANLGPDHPLPLNRRLVGLAARPGGTGYWFTASDGGVFNFGTAAFGGSMGGTHLNAPVVGMAATPDGGGYWLVAADGGIFNFGTAAFLGSIGGTHLNAPVVGMAPTPDGTGYWLVAADGGVFNFGTAANLGSLAGQGPPAPVVGIAASADGRGFWLATQTGQVSAFGVPDLGSLPAGPSPVTPTEGPTVGIAAQGSTGYWLLQGDAPIVDLSHDGPGVASVQERLSGLGYWDGPAGGVLDDATQQAIFAFQKYQGLPVTGSLDPDEQRLLATASRPRGQATAGNVIEIDKGRQLAFFVQNGSVVWVFHVSTGTERTYFFRGASPVAHTPTGNFNVSRVVNGWDPGPLGRLYRPRYFAGGVALHGFPEVPPFPASHGCVRVSMEGMNFIWDQGLAPIGEAVWVHE